MQEEPKEPSSTDTVVEARALTKVFRDFWGRPKTRALHRLDLKVGRGEVFGLLGPNGSGKSTTIKLLLGLLFPTAGEAKVLGGSPRDVRLKAKIGYLPEDSPFYGHLTAEETLRFCGGLFSIPAAELRRRTAELLKRVGLKDVRSKRLGEFSRGMLRRIGLAQALVNDPDLIILDEPTAGLDPLGTRDVKDLLRELKRRGKTVILSSHLLADVEDVCDRVAVLHLGELQALGEIGALLSDDRRTQITTGRLSPETLEGLIAFLREKEGPGLDIQVGKPTTRLEEFFIRTVRDKGRGQSAPGTEGKG